MNLVYDIEPIDLKLNPIKPATLRMQLNGIEASNGKRLAIFWWDDSKRQWQFLGGTVSSNEIAIGITKLGRYALMEVEAGDPPAGEFLFTCQPRVFSPKQGEQATITFSLAKEATVTLKIYNLDGRLQKTLVSGEIIPIGRQAIVWDGNDDDGELPSGPYLIALSVGDAKVKTKGVVILNR
jgi:hypothetical protein